MNIFEELINKARVGQADTLLELTGSVAALNGFSLIIIDLLVRALANQEGKTEEEIREELQPLFDARNKQAFDKLEEWGIKKSI